MKTVLYLKGDEFAKKVVLGTEFKKNPCKVQEANSSAFPADSVLVVSFGNKPQKTTGLCRVIELKKDITPSRDLLDCLLGPCERAPGRLEFCGAFMYFC